MTVCIGRRSAGLAGIAAWAFSASLSLAQNLNPEIRALIDRFGLTGAKVGVSVMDADSGEVLGAINADTQLIPASNMKLLTSGTAVAVLGSKFTFNTELVRAGDTLVVVGSGDPALGDPLLLKEMGIGVEDLFRTWIDAVTKSGDGPIKSIVVDDRVFDRNLAHPTWPADQLNRWYCAQVSGLNFHTNVISVFASPGRPGEAPRVSVEPRADWLDLQNKAKTAATGSNTLWGSRAVGSNSMTLHGAVRWTLPEPLEITVHEPARFFGRVLADRLETAGFGRIDVRLPEPLELLPAGQTVAVVRTPLDVVLRRTNVNSHNLYAEALLKRVGREVTGQSGSWENGAAVVRMATLQRLGPERASQIVIADGSGMSRDNLVTAECLARWLVTFHRDPKAGPAFIESLPIAQEQGSLKARFAGRDLHAEIRAKTGYIRAVSALSGYVTETSSGRRLVFSVIVNDFPSKTPLKSVKDFQEAVALLTHDALLRRVGAPELGG